MSLTTAAFGLSPDGRPCHLFTLQNAAGMRLRLTQWGVTIVQVQVPGASGLVDLCLGYDSLQGYLQGRSFLGCVVGRFANRIANGSFTLDGRTYTLVKNEGGVQTLHGGDQGFDKARWEVEPEGDDTLLFRHDSPEGDAGFPGALSVQLRVSLTDANELVLHYTAQTTHPTPVCLTNHAYWNLAGGGDVLGHTLQIEADHYLPTGPRQIPTGAVAPVADTPMDFRATHPVGARLAAAGGYDHCYVLRGAPGVLRPCATLRDPVSGRSMTVTTDQAGVQVYTGNHLDETGLRAQHYGPYAGLCLETQAFPDAVNQPHFPSTILRPGETYVQRTVHAFSF